MNSRYLSLLLLCLTPFAFLFGQPPEDFSFRVDISSIRESGFMKLLEKKFPQAQMLMDQAGEDEDFQEFTKLTGLKIEDLESIEISASGVEKVMAAQAQGRDPKMGSEVGFVVVAKAKSKVNFDALINLMMKELEEGEGPEARKKVEATRKSKDGTTYLTVPKELMDDPSFDSDMLLSMSAQSGDKGSVLAFGIPSQVMAYHKEGKLDPAFACLNVLAKDRQVTFAVKVPPSVWTQPGMNFDQQNPLMAGLANAVKGIRELGIAISFRKETLGLEICVNCVDAQSALGLWTVAQGGLGMAQLAASQEGQAPAILNRIKTQALEKNVVVKVEVLSSDLDEFAGMAGLGEPESSESPVPEKDSDSLVGLPAPSVKAKLLDGADFDLSKHKGKVVVLDFWATWCGPCVRALPELMKATSSFPKNKVAFVAVNQGEKPKQIKKFLKQKKWESLSVALDPRSVAGKNFNVEGIPQTVIIDKEGKVRHVHVGFSPDIGSRLKKEIQALVSE
ncbi:MAG: TlpA family protein disulfide reductase [Opitutae bacterium]|jgi:thiol-disulfide isomerase/thioredoxin|nr:TlpA family protein disulfide reductase [Opitutae bacterium]